MKKILTFFLLMGWTSLIHAQDKAEQQVIAATSFLVKALESGERSALEKITSAALSYGHSNGRVENKTEFVEALASKQSDFVSINISNQVVSVSENNAVVRHRLDAVTLDKGVAGEAHLNVMLVFRKEKGAWKLLARQAAKIVS